MSICWWCSHGVVDNVVCFLSLAVCVGGLSVCVVGVLGVVLSDHDL